MFPKFILSTLFKLISYIGPDGFSATWFHQCLIPFEETLIPLQDVLFFRRKLLAFFILFVLNAIFGSIYYLVSSNKLWFFLPLSLNLYALSFIPAGKETRDVRYSIAEISSFLATFIFFVKEIFWYSIDIAFAHEKWRIFDVFFILLLLTLTFTFIPPLIVIWLISILLFFFPLLAKTVTENPQASKSSKRKNQ